MSEFEYPDGSGWAEPVVNIYREAVRRLHGDKMPLLYGPAHVVWADENWDCAESCLEDFDRFTFNYTKEEMDVVRWSLVELIKIPLETREAEPEEYQGRNPELFPPRVKVVKP